jgi:threonine-phosphate decarboxylase
MINGHGGNVYEWARHMDCPLDEIIDMSSNINPLESPPQLLDSLKENIHLIHRLPEVDNKSLIRTFAAFYDKHIDQVTCGPGTTDFIYHLPEILNTKKVLIIGPTYADYADACSRHMIDINYLIADVSNTFSPELNSQDFNAVDTVFICNPNNPTGHFISSFQLRDICKQYPDVRFIIDESYLHFSLDYDDETMIRSGLNNVIVLCSFSKIFAIPGLRLGFMVANKDVINHFRKKEKPWNVNSLAQIAGTFLFDNMLEVQNFIQKTARHIQTEKQRCQDTLAQYKHIQLFGSFSPFILIQLPNDLPSENVCTQLAQKKYLVRNCSNFYGLSDHYIRIAFKDTDTNKELLNHLTGIFSNQS